MPNSEALTELPIIAVSLTIDAERESTDIAALGLVWLIILLLIVHLGDTDT
jgi:hypothetical protein